MSETNLSQTFNNNILYVFFSLYAAVLFSRILSHTYSRYLQHLERMDGQSSASISSGPASNIPSIV
jgi:hypothetical protein